jgi:polygalacturonase
MKIKLLILVLISFVFYTIAVNAQGKTGKPYSFSNLPVVKKVSFKKDTFNILKYAAKSDAQALNTTSINAAIADCSKKGGGVVVIPAGLFISGPVELKSNVNLHLNSGALLQFTSDFDQYPLVEGNWEGLPQMRNQSPIWATNQQNIAITGQGIIDGSGDAWRMVKNDKLTASQWKTLVASGGMVSADQKTWYPSKKSFAGSEIKNPGVISPEKTPEFYNSVKDFLRPNLMVLNNCRQILLEGVTFQNSPAWCLHPLMCQDLTVRNVTAKNPWYAQNGDGIDLESCKNVLIEGSTFDVGDDGICIKSGRDEAGRKRGMPTENVIVRNSKVYHAHGGFVIGSEMSGGAKNIFVSNCTFDGTDIGLRFKTTRGRGGVVEKIFVKDIVMKDIPGEAILFDMYYAAQDPVPLAGEKRDAPKVQLFPVTEATPVFKDFHINNIVCNGASKAIFIRGLPEMNIADIYLENIDIKAKQGIDLQEAKNISLKNVNVITDNKKPVVSIQNASVISIDNLNYKDDSEVLFNITGEKSKAISVKNTDTSKAKSKVRYGEGTSNSALEMK